MQFETVKVFFLKKRTGATCAFCLSPTVPRSKLSEGHNGVRVPHSARERVKCQLAGDTFLLSRVYKLQNREQRSKFVHDEKEVVKSGTNERRCFSDGYGCGSGVVVDRRRTFQRRSIRQQCGQLDSRTERESGARASSITNQSDRFCRHCCLVLISWPRRRTRAQLLLLPSQRRYREECHSSGARTRRRG